MHPVEPARALSIKEINPNKFTAMTRQNLDHLTQVYDLSPLLFMRKIRIQPRVTNQFRPTILLNTSHAENPSKLMAALIHEELYWWQQKEAKKFELAEGRLKKVFPKAPKAQTAHDQLSAHFTLVICYLEYKAILFYLGKARAKEIFSDFTGRSRTEKWAFYQIARNQGLIEKLVKQYQLAPFPLNQSI